MLKMRIPPQNGQSPLMRNLLRNAMAEKNDKSEKMSMPTAVNSIQKRAAADQYSWMPITIQGPFGIPKLDFVTIQADYDYTKEDAFDSLHRPVLNMTDDTIVERDDEEKSGFSVEHDLLLAGIEIGFTTSNDDKLKGNIDYMASRYVAMKDRINTEFVGEQRESYLKELDGKMDNYKNNLAETFSNKVGGIFEQNGVAGETEQLCKSVLAELDSKIAQYSDYVEVNKNYADIGEDEAWLAKDSAYMASELRKSMAGSTSEPTSGVNASQPKAETDTDNYSLDEMVKMQAFAKEMESFEKADYNSTRDIETGSESEESLGMKLAELSLRGKVFNDYSGVSDRIKDAVTKSVANFTTKMINKEQEAINKRVAEYTQHNQEWLAGGQISNETFNERMEDIRKNSTGLDWNAVYDVINKVNDTYEKTGSVSKSLMEGAVFAVNAYDKKASSSDSEGVWRYTDTKGGYWNNYFQNYDTHNGTNVYMQKESGLDTSINSWNDFMKNITSDSNAMFEKDHFSAKA